ncbi:hypothetical protein QM565_01865 [Geitlerinema splendidum]|jgi:hypothetical protein|nr:hypothetical protein [Geitlerinema splendidum]
MNYIFSLLLALLLLSSNTLNAEGLTEEELHSFLSQSMPVRQVNIGRIGGAGSNTISIRSVQVKLENGEERNYICKELKGMKREKQNLEAVDSFVAEYETFKGSQPRLFPPEYVSIARYRGALKQDFVLFDQASGQSVFDHMIEWTERGESGWMGEDPQYVRNHLSYAFSNVGRTIATFHLKHGEFDEETSTFKSITHGDLHIANIFYNLWSNEATLIDYETLSRSPNNIFIDVDRLLNFSKKEIEPLVEEKAAKKFIESCMSYILDEKSKIQKALYIKKRLDILDYFFAALKKGYEEAFTTAGYTLDFDEWQVKKIS